MKQVLWLTLVCAWTALPQAATEARPEAKVEAQPTAAAVEEAIAQLSKLTGMRPVKKVQFDTISKTQFKHYLDETIQEHIKPEDLRVQELALKRFGLVPTDFDLMRTTVDLLTEQAAAFYDYRKKKLFLMEGGDPDSQPMLVMHELAHALADQHFDLGKFMKRGNNDDESLARMAVLEGQATWLMLESVAQKMGASLKSVPAMAEAMSGATDQMTAQYPVLNSAPLYIRASLLFPYKEGFRFQHALVQKMGEAAFPKIFKEAPASTQQILHPEAYLAGTKPTEPPLPELANATTFKELTKSTVGEFDHAVLIEQYVGKEESARLAPMWRGGTLGLLEHKLDKHVVLLYASEWKDEEAARSMFEAYRKVLEKKNKKISVDSAQGNTIAGTSDQGAFHLRITGRFVAAVEGMKSIAELKNLTAALKSLRADAASQY
ncbi:MAG TPA: hypothetical protein VEQ63_11365 [Bryobacteraceae bacterium]|nr:hypothetical protein [Bryobacteraceae bacterium]